MVDMVVFVGTKLTSYFLVSPSRKSPKKSTQKERLSFFFGEKHSRSSLDTFPVGKDSEPSQEPQLKPTLEPITEQEQYLK